MNRVRTGELPWTTLDRLHRMTLDRLLGEFGVTGLSEADIDTLNRAWQLDLRPDEVMMVAAHSGDLRAAAQVRLKTAFVTRLQEFGPNGTPDLKAASPVDLSATDFNDLARQLGA